MERHRNVAGSRSRRRTGRARLLGLAGTCVVALAGLVATAAPASAHPLGNFTTNSYSGLRVQPGLVVVDYVVDLAEIPTVRAEREITRQGEEAWAGVECTRLARGLRLRADGRDLAPAVRTSAVAFGEGAGGLSTLRLSCSVAAPRATSPGRARVTYEDANFTDRVGWREVTAVGDRTTLAASDVPVESVSARLTRYPDDLLSSPLRVSGASLVVVPGGPAAPVGGGADKGSGGLARPLAGDALTARFTALVGRQDVDAPFIALAILLATVLGAVHAFAPGHGKTVMAAYLVGQRGSRRQALLIGASVTVTHTLGVLLLGLALSASSVLAPERLYPWLTVASGILFAAFGLRLLVGAVRQQRAARAAAATRRHAGHDHHDDHEQGHHDHDGKDQHQHAHGGLVHSHPLPDPAGEPIGWRSLVVLGLAGGMVPTPSALVVLLGAIALGRVWLGVVLVLAYGIGMAATLTGAGLVLVRARGWYEARAGRRRGRLATLTRLAPLATAGLIVVAGSAVVARGAAGL